MSPVGIRLRAIVTLVSLSLFRWSSLSFVASSWLSCRRFNVACRNLPLTGPLFRAIIIIRYNNYGELRFKSLAKFVYLRQ